MKFIAFFEVVSCIAQFLHLGMTISVVINRWVNGEFWRGPLSYLELMKLVKSSSFVRVYYLEKNIFIWVNFITKTDLITYSEYSTCGGPQKVSREHRRLTGHMHIQIQITTPAWSPNMNKNIDSGLRNSAHIKQTLPEFGCFQNLGGKLSAPTIDLSIVNYNVRIYVTALYSTFDTLVRVKSSAYTLLAFGTSCSRSRVIGKPTITPWFMLAIHLDKIIGGISTGNCSCYGKNDMTIIFRKLGRKYLV